MSSVIILGLGLIGGSIAKNLQLTDSKVVGFDADQSSIDHAIKIGLVDQQLFDLGDLKNEEYKDSLVIIATPPAVTLDIMHKLEFLFHSSITITDTSSTKTALDSALQEYGQPSNVILSHPVAGSHLSGSSNAILDLFKEKAVILSYTDKVLPIHLEKVKNLWSNLGANCIKLDSQTHDYIFSYSSHLPHVAAYALLGTLQKVDQKNIAQFSGGGLGEFLRLTSSSPKMWADIFSINNANIIPSIDSLIESLNEMKAIIGDRPEELESFLTKLKDFKEEYY